MSDIFIAHVEEDADVALGIALRLEEAGYTTWTYEVDSIPGPSYLLQTARAVEECKAVVLVISPQSVGSRQVTRELVRAHESGKEFIPVRRDITHIEFQTRQPEWREAMGAAASIEISREGVAGVVPAIIDGLKSLSIHPGVKPDVVHVRKVLDHLQGRGEPQAYTPKFLADKILTTRSSIEGERKLVTVLFADVASYTSISEKLDPEEVHQIMDGCFRIVMDEIHKHEGTINQFLGDGVMALFGAPVAHEDHAQRACHAALGVQRALEKYGERIERECGVEFKMRVGLNSGPVIVGSIGDDLRMDYTAIGDTTNLASRMEGLAEPGTILVSRDTHRLAGDFFKFEPLGKVEVKGKEEAQEAYELIEAGGVETRIAAAELRGLSRFVGRRPEMEHLMGCYRRVKEGQGQVVGIVGEAGVGKSRLLLEFARSWEGEDFTYFEGRCIHYGATLPYYPFIQIVKRYCGIEDTDREFIYRKKLKERVLGLDPALEATLPFFEDLLSLKVEDKAFATMEPELRRAGTFDAIKTLFIRESQERPLVLAIEDMHWIDRSSEDFLTYLIESIAHARVLLLCLYRPEYRHRWGELSYYTRLGVDQLSPTSSAELVEALLGGAKVADDLRELVPAKAGGNPLFVEEFTRSLLDTGAIARSDDRYVLTRRPSEIKVPDTLQAVLAARMDRLEEALKRVLQVASVIGRDFAFSVLRSILEMEEQLRPYLASLQRLEFIYEKRLLPELEYMFKHALTQEVAYNSLLIRRRKEFHRQIAEAIEQLYSERIEEYYPMLAHHFLEGNEPTKAVDYSIKAGDKAASVFSWDSAVRHYKAVLELLEGKEGLRQRAEVLRKLACILGDIGDWEAMRQYAEEGLDAYYELGDKPNLASMHMLLGRMFASGGARVWDEEKTLEHFKSAAAIVEEGPDTEGKGAAYIYVAHAYLHMDEPAAALPWAQKDAISLVKTISPDETLANAVARVGRVEEGIELLTRGWEFTLGPRVPIYVTIHGRDIVLLLALVRDVPEGMGWAERIVPEIVKLNVPRQEKMVNRASALMYTLAGETGKARESCQVIERLEPRFPWGCPHEDVAGLGFFYLRAGEWEKAEQYLEKAVAANENANNLAAANACSCTLGSLYLEQGNYTRAEEFLLKSLGTCHRGGNVLVELWVLPLLCELYLKIRQPEKAAEYVERGFELLKPDQNWYGLPAPMYLARGMLATAQQDWETATSSFGKAIEINRQYQLPWDEARTLYERGLMYLARGQKGDRWKANEDSEEALAIFQRVGAKKDVDKVLGKKRQRGGKKPMGFEG